jgi:hypothetical protein
MEPENRPFQNAGDPSVTEEQDATLVRSYPQHQPANGTSNGHGISLCVARAPMRRSKEADVWRLRISPVIAGHKGRMVRTTGVFPTSQDRQSYFNLKR